MAQSSLRRIYRLDRMIRLGRLESTEQAARDLEVSKRTIERDLETLRDDLGATLEYSRSKKRYMYEGKPFVLPAQWLTEHEIAIILIAERALRMYTGTSFHDEIHPTFNKLLDPIREEKDRMDYIQDLCRSVHFHHSVTPVRNVSHEFSTILESILTRRSVRMTYRSAKARRPEQRELDPYALVNDGGEWYVAGECRRSRRIKTFVLSQMEDAELTDRHFGVPPDFNVHTFLGAGFGRMRGVSPQKISLEITPPAASWVARSIWHRTQVTSEREDGSIGVTLECPVTDSLIRWVLQMGECVRVVAPRELRTMVAEKAGALAKNNCP